MQHQLSTHRQRLLTALAHKEPDRVPFDLGGSVLTGIHIRAYQSLRRYLGLPVRELIVRDTVQQLARVEDDVLERLGVDVRNVSPNPLRPEIHFKETDDGKYTYYYDDFGIGWRMPVSGGFYFDMFHHPLGGDITEGDIDRFALPDVTDPVRFTGLKETAQGIIDGEKRAVYMGNVCAGIFELYLWVRGFQNGYADLAGNLKLALKLLDRFKDLQIVYWGKVFSVMGDTIDVVQLADDFAGQDRMLISPATYRKHLKPLHREVCDFIHSHSRARIFFHSCGAIRPVIPDLIEAGVDIINPVQVSAAGMDSAELKREFGKDLVFWGGGVDTQRIFDERNTPDAVREDVKRRLNDLMPGGGFVFATVHNIQANVPPENIVAMWETVQKYGKY
ncbi:MAG: uroporphyrinogen decarboxylase family protein [Dehalococcoidia bacterium]|nr:uroporphyrinogen decarboxylase family protein [Dehalococcoidia bacterium]